MWLILFPLNEKSRVKGDFQARFCERLELKCPCLLDSPSKFMWVGQVTPACRTEAAYIYTQYAQLYSYLSTSTKHSNDAALRYITFPPLQGVLHLQILVMYINHGEGCCFQHKVLVIVHFCVSSSHS